MATIKQLEAIAARLLPDVEPAAALKQTNLFLARVMSAGNDKEFKMVIEHFGKPALRAVLNEPPEKIFDRQSWNLWHNHFHLETPEKPDSFFTVYPWFKDRTKPKGPITAAMIDHVPAYGTMPVYSCG
jgi:hypothetical protein